MKSELFESISVNLETLDVSYPQMEGFELDMAKMYRTAKMFTPFCNGDVVMAVRQAVHGQMVAFMGTKSLFGGMR